MSTQLQTTTNNKAELIIDMLGKEQSGFRDLFKTQKAFDKFKSNFRLMTVKNPDLLNKLMTPDGVFKTVEGKRTLFMALYQAAHDGLCVDGKRAALVPFNVSVGSGEKIDTIQYFPMVYGIREKVFEYTEMLLEAQIVYSNDLFEWEQGDNPKLIHKPSLELDDNARPLAVYAVARKDGKVVDRTVMRIGEINKIMKGSKAGFKQKWDKATNRYATDAKGDPIGEVVGIWKDHWEERAKKTAIRRLAKQLPLVDEVETIIEQVDQYYQNGRKDVTPQTDEQQPQNFTAALDQQQPNSLQTNIVDGVDQATGEVLQQELLDGEPIPDDATAEEIAEAREAGISVQLLRKHKAFNS